MRKALYAAAILVAAVSGSSCSTGTKWAPGVPASSNLTDNNHRPHHRLFDGWAASAGPPGRGLRVQRVRAPRPLERRTRASPVGLALLRPEGAD